MTFNASIANRTYDVPSPRSIDGKGESMVTGVDVNV